MTITLDDRIHGALLGAAIGAELSFAVAIRRQRGECWSAPAALFEQDYEPLRDWRPEPCNQWGAGVRPLVDLGVRAYLAADGRVDPEGFAALFRDDPGVATPAFAFDGLHTVQELLKEGMPARLAGLHNAPCGLIGACMPAVGLFHFADPERAYLDGVELASVAQPRLGADWAALGAAAVAAACRPGADADSIIRTVLALAHANDHDLFLELKDTARGNHWASDDAAWATWWCASTSGGRLPQDRRFRWHAPNPLRVALPALARWAGDPRRLILALVGAHSDEWCTFCPIGVHAVPAVIAGSVAGALGGAGAFPAGWRAWAEPLIAPWLGLRAVVRRRLEEERGILAATAALGSASGGSDVLRDKLRGALLAGSIGNAMGSPVEGRQWQQIDREHPAHVLTILEPRRLESEDDNQMMMLLAETYLAREGAPVMARHFGRTWADRLDRDHFFPLCMGNAYDGIRAGGDPRVLGHWAPVTGSTVMCLEPVGMFNLGDPRWAAQDAAAVAYMYQRGLDVVAAASLAAATAAALLPGASVDSVLEAALAALPRTPFRTFDARRHASPHAHAVACLEVAARHDDVLAARAELYERCLCYHMIDPLELWGLALAMFRIARGDVRQAAIGGTNIGRDSDTIAGRAAMLAGALNGCAGIPREWVAMFGEAPLARIDRVADGLHRVIAGPRLAAMRLRAQAG